MNNQYVGSDFDDFLEEEGVLSEVSAEALKRVISWQIQNFLDEQDIKKTAFAKQLSTSRSQLNRLLDPGKTNLELKTLVSTAKAMGKHVEIRFVD